MFTGGDKLKDYKLKLHVKPVSQPVRRIPFDREIKLTRSWMNS